MLKLTLQIRSGASVEVLHEGYLSLKCASPWKYRCQLPPHHLARTIFQNQQQSSNVINFSPGSNSAMEKKSELNYQGFRSARV